MASSRGDRDHNPFKELTNIVNTYPKEQTQITDPKELKRQKAREQYANKFAEKKNELLKRRRQSYHAKKVMSTLEKVDREQPAPRNGEMDATQSEMPVLPGLPTEQGHDNIMSVAHGINSIT